MNTMRPKGCNSPFSANLTNVIRPAAPERENKLNHMSMPATNISRKEPKTEIICPNKIGPYQLTTIIGEGGFSVVKLAIHEETGNRFACKIVPKKRLLPDSMEDRFEREVRIMQKLRHPGICRLFDLFKDTLNYYIVMELCQYGPLYGLIIQKKTIEEPLAKYIFKQVIEVLQYIHDKGVAHRDIKPENILIDEKYRIKFIDFGFSTDQNNLVSTKCGSPSYTSPECISGQPYDAKISDIWSCGVLLFAMLFGQLPWTKINQSQLLQQILRGEYFIPVSISAPARKLLYGLMEVDVGKRYTVDRILEDPWLADVDSSPFSNDDISNAQKIRSSDSICMDLFFEKNSNGDDEEYFSREGKSLLTLVKRKTFQIRRVVHPNLAKRKIPLSANLV